MKNNDTDTCDWILIPFENIFMAQMNENQS